MRPLCLLVSLLALTTRLWATDAPGGTPVEKISPAPLPPREFRAAWIATVANIDWPSKPGLPVAQQKAELLALLDQAALLHFNAVFFQVRSVSDAVYPSALEPWSEYLTGVQGRAPEPFYDPLALAITEAHKRGLELHAWFNPFRAGHPESKSPPAPNHVTRLHPGLIRRYGPQTWLDPGEPAAQDLALAAILDVVKRYDVDGIVLDDYFYPYPEKNYAGRQLDFPDDVTWKKYGQPAGLPRDAWRRDNVNRFVHRLSLAIKAAKPSVQFGISPFGIWRPQNPAAVRGMDAYEIIYADARLWLMQGWVDYLSPQLYWTITAPQQSFPQLLDWWHAQNVRARHLWPGLADFSTGGKFAPDEIPHQVQLTRQRPDPGTIHYHLRSITENPSLAAALQSLYTPLVLYPASPWIATALPLAPKLTVNTGDNSAHIRWASLGGNPAMWWLLQSRTNGAWTTALLPSDRTDFYLNHVKPDAVTLRAVDRLGNLSEPALWQPRKYLTPEPIKGEKKLNVSQNPSGGTSSTSPQPHGPN